MGKVTLTIPQQTILTILGKEPYFPKTFYLTGGTALAAFYYHHRKSEDIDLFTPNAFDQQFVRSWMDTEKRKRKWNVTYAQVFERQTYEISWGKTHVKVEFVHYPYKQISRSSLFYQGFQIDSKSDIATNKLLTISQRTTTKDFVDLFYLLKKDFTLWDLFPSAERKFGIEIEPVYAASLLSKASELNSLPMMKTKLTLAQLQTFFKKEAIALASKFVKE